MENLRIAIVEDDQIANARLVDYLKKYQDESKIEMQVKSYPNSSLFLNGYNGNFDIIFMDIELPDMNGLDAIKRIRERDSDVMVIFVTNMAQYAVKGYEVQAFDFIVKPVQYYSFEKKLTLAIKQLDKRIDQEIWISNKTGKFKIKISNIKYVEVISHSIIFHLLNGDVKTTGTLDKIMSLLPAKSFSLCNRCYLVNLRYVTKLFPTQVEVGGELLNVSRAKHSTFLHDLNNYLIGK